MAKCLVFAPRQYLFLLSDLWQLHLECEKAFELASEPLLGAMRLQWLYDALETAQAPVGHELLARLLSYEDKTSFIQMVGIWQKSLQEAGLSAQAQCEASYAACFIEMAKICDIPITDISSQVIKKIGISMAQSKAGFSEIAPVSKQDIRKACGKNADWLVAINETVQIANIKDVSADNLLIFRLFWRVYLKGR